MTQRRGSRKPNRDAAIAEMNKKNRALSLTEIGRRFVLSASRIRSILQRTGQTVLRRRDTSHANRDADVRRMRDSGMTLQAIGEQLGLSRQRVCQVVKRTGSTYQRTMKNGGHDEQR